MHAKAFKQSIIHKKKQKPTIHSINKQITKLSPMVPSGVAIMSHPRGGARRRGDPRLISGSFVFVNKGVAT
jgi:hypothetical protein